MSRPSGSCALHSSQEQPRASQIASAVPSPPSAIGTTSICASGITSSSPFAMFWAASRALSAPLNLSGAIKIFIVARASRLRIWSASRRHALPQFPLQNFSDKLRIGFAFRQLNYLSLEKIQRCYVPYSKIPYRFRVRCDHFVTQFFNRAYVAQLLDAFFFHNRGCCFSGRKHFGKNVFALFAADFSAVDQVYEFIKRLRRNWALVHRFASGAERVLQIVQNPVTYVLRLFCAFGSRLEIS